MPARVQGTTVAEVVVAQLKLWGVRRIYGVIGDAIFGLMDVLAREKEIKFIAVKHESVAAMMASAEARLTGGPGVCISQMGPGMGNLLNGLGDAHLDRLPVIAITGQAPLKKIGTDYKQYVNQQEWIHPLACFSSLVSHPDAIGELLGKALHLSLTRRDVAHLSIPADVFPMPTTSQPVAPPVVFPINGDPTGLSSFITALKEASHPVVITGRGAKKAKALIPLLAQKWGAVLLVSPDSNGIVSEDFPSFLNGIGEGGNPYAADLLKEADMVLFVGTPWWPEGYVPSSIRKLQIDDKEENIGKGISVELGIVGEMAGLIQGIVNGLSEVLNHQDWLNRIETVKAKWAREKEQECKAEGNPVQPARIIRALENTIEKDAIVTLDYGDSILWFYRNFRPAQQDILLSCQWRTMGFGLPAALAAKCTCPERQVVAITGDGGVEMVLADLLTATRYHLKVTVIVFNNGTLQEEKDKMILYDLHQEGVTLTNPDFVQLATACGWDGFLVEGSEELEQTLAQALSSPRPTLVDVRTAKTILPDFLTIKKV